MIKIKLSLLLLPLLLNSCYAQPSPSGHSVPVAVMELFTSEGCSSCPPADRLLAQYSADSVYEGVQVFTLAYHVDYWDYLGWRDSFSSSAFSDRQRIYADAMQLSSVYTPQMIVNGTDQFVGSDPEALHKALSNVSKEKSSVRFSDLHISRNNAGSKIEYEASGNISDCEIHIVLVTPQVAVNVRRGENRGHLLSHSNVVRTMLTVKAVNKGEIDLPDSFNNNDLILAFIQNKKSNKIVTAAKLNLGAAK